MATNYLEIEDDMNDGFDDSFEKKFKEMLLGNKLSRFDVPDDSQSDINFEHGFCLKTRDLKKSRKIFVNFCHSPQVEKPKLDLTEDELRALLQSSDADKFTIPLLIKKLLKTRDKSGKTDSLVCDIILNTDLYCNKVIKSQLYKTFLITVALETIEQKWESEINWEIDKNDWIVLKNKKYQDSLTLNTLVNSGENPLINSLRPKDDNGKRNGPTTTKNLITEVGEERRSDATIDTRELGGSVSSTRRSDVSFTSATSTSTTTTTTPKYKLSLDLKNNVLFGQLHLPKVHESNEVTLEVGEDRIVLKSANYNLDVFVPVSMKQDEVRAEFDIVSKQLKITMPVV